jgi:hypothetical protein
LPLRLTRCALGAQSCRRCSWDGSRQSLNDKHNHLAPSLDDGGRWRCLVTQLGPKKASVLRSCASHSIQPPQGRAKPSSGAAPHAALRPPPHSAAARSALASVAPSARERHFRLEIEIKIERGKGKMLREEDCRERLHEESEKGGEKKKKGKKRKEKRK